MPSLILNCKSYLHELSPFVIIVIIVTMPVLPSLLGERFALQARLFTGFIVPRRRVSHSHNRALPSEGTPGRATFTPRYRIGLFFSRIRPGHHAAFLIFPSSSTFLRKSASLMDCNVVIPSRSPSDRDRDPSVKGRFRWQATLSAPRFPWRPPAGSACPRAKGRGCG